MRTKIYKLIYISTPSFQFAQNDLTQLLAQSRDHNSRRRVTGLLLHAKGGFMQLLEGSHDTVLELMARIQKDRRHHNVRILEEGFAARREFREWAMAFLDFESPEVRALPGYSTFLESPFEAGDVADQSPSATRPLHYFKAIMTASNPEILNLAEAIAKRGAKLSGKKMRTRKS